MNIKNLKKILQKSWKRETCAPGLREEWSTDNPSLGQCAITALIVNDMYGGKIMRCMTSTGSHYFNEINGNRLDFTVEQFYGEVPQYEDAQERTREYLLGNEDTKKRYEELLSEVVYRMQMTNSQEVEELIKQFQKIKKRVERNMEMNKRGENE